MSEKPGRFEGDDQHGWSPDIGAEGDEAQRGVDKAMAGPGGDRGEGRTGSEAEREGMDSAETDPDSPHGAGDSTHRGAEEQPDSSETVGHKGESQRPYGRTDEDDDGVGDDDSSAGNQGGGG